MKLEHKFKSIDYSQSLVEHTQSGFGKLAKYELKPEKVMVTYGATRHQKSVEFCIQHANQFIRAKATSDDYYEAVDKAIHKLKNQLDKRKKRVQNHKRFSHSKEGKLYQLNDYMEIDHKEFRRKAG